MKLVIGEDSVYGIDEECMQRKEAARREKDALRERAVRRTEKNENEIRKRQNREKSG